MRVWILQTGEPLHIDKGSPRPMRAINLSNKLIERGHNVVIWSSAFSHQSKKHRVKEFTSYKVNSNLEIRLIPSCGYKRHIGLARLIDHLQLSWNLKKILKKEFNSPDIAFIGYPPIETASVMSKWLKKRNISVVLDVKDLWPSMFVEVFPKILQPVARVFFHPYFYLAKRTIRDAKGVSTMAPAFLDWILKFANKKLTQNDMVFRLTTPRANNNENEVIFARKWWANQGLDSNKPIVFFAGSFMSVFDFDPIITAAKKLKKCQFVLCGDGDYLADLKYKMKGLNNVFFPGWIDRIKIESLSEISIAALAPYKNIDNYMFNTPNKIVDALSLGLPILTPLQGEVKGLIDKYQVGLSYTDDLEECINRIIKDIKLQKELSDNAKKLYEKEFDFNKVYDEFTLHLESLI